MCRILIVEDEAVVRMALRLSIETQENMHAEILEAGDGQTALDICREMKPDILIVDINIPIITGLELIETVQKLLPDAKILITTAHDKSKWIRKALSLGVIDYLIKPIEDQDLYQGISKCRMLIAEERSQRAKLNNIYHYSQQHIIKDIWNEEMQQDQLRRILNHTENDDLCLIMLVFAPNSGEEANMHYVQSELRTLMSERFMVLASETDGKLIAILQPLHAMDQLQLLAMLRIYASILYYRTMAWASGSLFISKPVGCMDELHAFIQKTRVRTVNGFRHGLMLPSMPCNGLCAPQDRSRLRQRWVLRLAQREPVRIVNAVRRKLSLAGTYWPGVDLFIEACLSMDSTIDAQALLSCFLSEAPYAALQDFLLRYYDKPMQSDNQSMTHLPVDAALHIIRTRFSEDISQGGIAEELGLNASYFSTLFKKVTGDTFINTLSNTRIEHAAEMIRSGETDVNRIAEACGYSNKQYLFYVFRTKMGVSLPEYMEAAKLQ